MCAAYEDKSFWLKTAGPYSPGPALEGEQTVDIGVIGGGYTGLAAAYNLLQDEPNLRVALLEAYVIGYGASGRNGGLNMTLFSLEPAVTKALFGQARTVEAHRYMERAVDYVRDLVARHNLQSEYEHPGFLQVATTLVVTEPLTLAQLATIGWRNRQAIEDARNLVHHFRLTADNHLAMGGSDGSISFARDMETDLSHRIFADLERDVVRGAFASSIAGGASECPRRHGARHRPRGR
jgi:hypothetical protein